MRLLVVDDSVVFRMFLRKCLSGLDEVEVVGAARDGMDAMDKVAELAPDVITLDMNMPRMNGMETLAALKRDHPGVKVIIVAAETEDDAGRTVQALKAGAFDFILKPGAGEQHPAEAIRSALVPRLRALRDSRHKAAAGERRTQEPRRRPGHASATRMDILAIGASTGGPNALDVVMRGLPAELPVPVTVVQHMPPLFIRSLAQRINDASPLACKVAEDGEQLLPGKAYFAPGDWHLEVVAGDHGLCARLSDAPPMHFCRPAVDAMFHSLTRLAPRFHTLAVVLTGMGKDGAAGALAVAEQSGLVIAQDEATSTVWGMPGATVGLGAAHHVLPLRNIPGEILAVLKTGPRT